MVLGASPLPTKLIYPLELQIPGIFIGISPSSHASPEEFLTHKEIAKIRYFRGEDKLHFMNVHIRPATLEDLPVLRSFEQGLIRDERPFDPTIRPDPVTYYDLEELIMDRATRIVVAESQGEIVASGYATRKVPRHYLDHDSYAYLGFMYTRPEFRGLGINGEIIRDLRQWARGQGFLEVRLTVYVDNQAAVRAYEKAGFSSHIVEMRLREEP